MSGTGGRKIEPAKEVVKEELEAATPPVEAPKVRPPRFSNVRKSKSAPPNKS